MHQPDLFEHVTAAYLKANGEMLSNAALYRRVSETAGIGLGEFARTVPIGRSGQPHSTLKRRVRWMQQSLRAMGVIERVAGRRGAWRLAEVNRKGLHEASAATRLVAFSTRLGVAIYGRCESVLAGLDQPITLVLTSPPYCLQRQRDYGGPTGEQAFVDFIVRALEPIVAHLAPGGSVCLNLSNDSFVPGSPARTLARERLLIALHDRLGLHRMDTLIWLNRSKIPGPTYWASRQRVQLHSAYETIEWLSTDPRRITADNRRVLEQHTRRHLDLMAQGGEQREAVYGDGAYRLRHGSFGRVSEGRIPRNVIERGHRCRDADRYRADARALALPLHGARQPLAIPDFLVRFLSKVGDLVVDPFAGTATTGMAAEQNGRRWICVEAILEYLRAGAERFRSRDGFWLSTSVE